MSDYIKREDALEVCEWYQQEYTECAYALDNLTNEMRRLHPADVVATVKRREEIVEGDVCGGETLEVYDVSFPGIPGAPAIQLKHNVERNIWGVWMPEKIDRDEIIRDALKKWEAEHGGE